MSLTSWIIFDVYRLFSFWFYLPNCIFLRLSIRFMLLKTHSNSSSSSFVAVLELQLENGKKVRATHDNSNGEDDVISYFPGSYRFPGRPLADMKGCYVKNPDQVEKNSPDAWLKIVKGSLRLMCHTYGEEAYRAYPNQMLPELGYECSV